MLFLRVIQDLRPGIPNDRRGRHGGPVIGEGQLPSFIGAKFCQESLHGLGGRDTATDVTPVFGVGQQVSILVEGQVQIAEYLA